MDTPQNTPQIDYTDSAPPPAIQIASFHSRVVLRFTTGPTEGFALTTTQARQLAHALRTWADRAQKWKPKPKTGPKPEPK